ncbi:MAG TPA: tetratricopeptide repeat protein [Anaeromyxobacter sp.]|nr:tetratricopeptide repeat protein [Anaeromyxobacter sp.]
MHVLSLALLVASAQTPAPEEPKVPPVPVPVTAPAAAAPSPGVPVPMTAAAIERMGQGDRAFLERDFRNALFAYTDAAYMAPTSAAPRVKMGRAYLALRYPERAIEQAEKALALDPGNADARKLVEEARAAAAAAPPPAGAAPTAAAPAPRVFKYVPESDAAPPPPSPPPAPAPAKPRVELVPPAAAAAAPVPAVSAPEPVRAPAPTAAPPAEGPTAAQRYREGLALLRDREFEKAIAAFSEAVTLDPKLAVAFAARASARFALGAYRGAANDYRKAIDLDPKLATPLYGLAECHRVLGERKEAAEMYRRYAESRAPDVRDDLRATAAKRAEELK